MDNNNIVIMLFLIAAVLFVTYEKDKCPQDLMQLESKCNSIPNHQLKVINGVAYCVLTK